MPDPTKKLTLTKARLLARDMRADGVPPEAIDAFLKAKVGLTLDKVESPAVTDYLRAAGMGATFGFLDELAGVGAAIVPGGKDYDDARDDIRADYDAANDAATGWEQAALTGAELLGGIGTGMGAGLAAKAAGMGANAVRTTGVASRALKGGLTGAAAGGVSGAGYTQKSGSDAVLDALKGAGMGAAAGVALPVASRVVAGTGRYARDLLRPGYSVAREAALQMPDDAARTLARQEALAPGTAMQADLSPGLMKVAGKAIGADPRSAALARQATAARIPKLYQAAEQVGEAYNQWHGVKLPATDAVTDVLEKYSKGRGKAILAPGGQVNFETAQALRTKLREGWQRTKSGSKRHEYKEAWKTLNGWMQKHIPDLKDVDSRYGFLKSRIKHAEKFAHYVDQSGGNYSAKRAFNANTESLSGTLGGGKRTILDRLAGMVEPSRADRARAAWEMLMEPGARPIAPKIPGPPPAFQRYGSTALQTAAGLGAGQLSGGLLSY